MPSCTDQTNAALPDTTQRMFSCISSGASAPGTWFGCAAEPVFSAFAPCGLSLSTGAGAGASAAAVGSWRVE
eukprot:36907-Pleurochrysis_carterae.AAC.1